MSQEEPYQEESAEEVSEIEEIKRKQEIAKSKSKVAKFEKIRPRPQPPVPEPLTIHIPVKEASVRKPESICPHIVLKAVKLILRILQAKLSEAYALVPKLRVLEGRERDIRFRILQAKLSEAYALVPKLRVLEGRERDIRFPILEPLKLKQLRVFIPRISIRSAENISIRPLIPLAQVSALKPIKPRLKACLNPVLLLPKEMIRLTAEVRSSLIKPILSLSSQTEEIVKPVETMGVTSVEGGKPEDYDLFKLLLEEDEMSLKEFRKAMTQPEPVAMVVFFIPAVSGSTSFPGLLTLEKLLATEYKRAFGEIEATHDAASALSEPSIHVVRFSSEKVRTYAEAISKVRKTYAMSEEKFMESLEDLMTELGITNEGKKLVLFMPSEVDVGLLRSEVEKIISSTYQFRAKYSKLPKEVAEQVARALAWILSIDSSEEIVKHVTSFLELTGDIDRAFSQLEKRRTEFLNDLLNDEDLIRIPPWENESEEHLLLKLIAYKTLKEKFPGRQVFIEGRLIVDEERDLLYRINERGEYVDVTPYVPDLRVENKVWVEIETLRGIKDPRFLVQKYQRKSEYIRDYAEFWLIIPCFEIMMHYEAIYSLLSHLFNLFGKRVNVSLWRPDLVKRRIRLVKELRANA